MVPPATVKPSSLPVVLRIFCTANPVDSHRLPNAVFHLAKDFVDAFHAFLSG